MTSTNSNLDAALYFANIGLCKYRLDSGKMFWSKRIRTFFGVSLEHAPDYENFLDCVHPLDRGGRDGIERKLSACGHLEFDAGENPLSIDAVLTELPARGLGPSVPLELVRSN
jgi:hypothetical protein